MIVDSQKLDTLIHLLGHPDVEGRGLNAQFWCPFCRSLEQGKRKLAVRISDGLTHCWVCGWRGNVIGVARALGKRDALDELKRLYKHVDRVQETADAPDAVSLPEDFCLVGKLLERDVRDPDHLACLRYLDKRGVTAGSAWRFCLGVSDRPEYRRRVLFPSFDAEGALNYLTARAVDADVKPRYVNVAADRREVVFGEMNVDWTRPLILVEGPFDMLACNGMNVTMAMGSLLDEAYALFNKIVANRTPVTLAFDQDAQRKQDDLAARLMKYGVQVKKVKWSKHDADSDPSSVGSAAFKRLIAAAEPVNETTVLRSRLERALAKSRLV